MDTVSSNSDRLCRLPVETGYHVTARLAISEEYFVSEEALKDTAHPESHVQQPEWSRVRQKRRHTINARAQTDLELEPLARDPSDEPTQSRS